jgi:hypothetical protein
MLSNQYNFTATDVTITQVVANIGAMTGGTVVGYCSQIFGRRFSIIFVSVIGGALLYPYTFVGDKSVVSWYNSLNPSFQSALIGQVSLLFLNNPTPPSKGKKKQTKKKRGKENFSTSAHLPQTRFGLLAN